MKGLLLAGGHGTRLRPLTFTGNKHMIPIANQPILFYGLKHLAQAGIQEVGIVLGPLHEGIREAIGTGLAFGLRVTYIHQGDPKGLAHAVLCAREFLGNDPFVMYLGDNLLQEGVTEFVRIFERESPDAVVGVTPVEVPQQYGIVELDGDKIRSIEEKPAKPRSNLALIGVYLFTPAIYPIISALTPSGRGELEITEAIWRLHQAGGRIVPYAVRGWWKDTGRPEDLLHANTLVLRSLPPASFDQLGEVSAGAKLRGGVRIGAGTVVDDGVEIEGPVVIGSGARLRAGTRVGPETSVGDGVVLDSVSVRRSIILEGARIEGPLRVVDSLIGRNVAITSRTPLASELTLILGDAAQIRL
ncbi:MAG: glucose-1-phosphate thymidylyltransferase [Thermoplasmata archaeon]|nr:glucose-1-phosphate thymidylyltransferase [Thermoplasmata archaeon]